MLRKELEEKTGVNKENIRFYEKEGLLMPERSPNGYRNYSEEDEKKLKRIVLLRKLGVPVAAIRELLEGDANLSDVISQQIQDLTMQREQLLAAIQVCEMIRREENDFAFMDEEKYLKEIKELEQNGKVFHSLVEDVMDHAKDTLVNELGQFHWWNPLIIPVRKKGKGNVVFSVLFILWFVVYGGFVCRNAMSGWNVYENHRFLQGSVSFAMLVVLWVVLKTIVYLWVRKKPAASKRINQIGSVACSLVVLATMAVMICIWYKIIQPFPYEGGFVYRDASITSMEIRKNGEYLHYDVQDEDYIQQVKSALDRCEPTGVYCAARTEFDLPDCKILQFQYDEQAPTTLFVYEVDGNMYVAEPNFGVVHAGEELLELIGAYEAHIVLKKAVVAEIRQLFEHDDNQITEGVKVILVDRETGEDVTEEFLADYRDAYERQDYETIWKAMERVAARFTTIQIDE